MRKLNLRNQEKKDKKIKQFLVGGILILVMFFSVLGYSFKGKQNENSNVVKYNGLEFINQNGHWILSDSNFIFKYNPLQVEEIPSELKFLTNYANKPLYIYSENTEAEAEIYTNLNRIVQRMQYACLTEENCEGDRPIKTCKDNFIIILENNGNEITQDENCVFIKGAYENLTKLSDEFLFKILGIREQ